MHLRPTHRGEVDDVDNVNVLKKKLLGENSYAKKTNQKKLSGENSDAKKMNQKSAILESVC